MRLVASALVCRRAEREVFSDLSFSLADGEALLVTGPNGAGKSSLLRLIAGLLRPEAGSVTLEDGDPELTIPEQCHLLGHLDAIKPSLSVAENLHFWAGFLGGDSPPSGAHPLDLVELRHLEDLPAGYLSAGQRRRLSLARLSAVQRAIWLLDEPTSALDADGQEHFASLARDHLASGGIIVAATHAPLDLHRATELRLGVTA